MPKTKVITIPPQRPISETNEFARLVSIVFGDEDSYNLVVRTFSAAEMGQILANLAHHKVAKSRGLKQTRRTQIKD